MSDNDTITLSRSFCAASRSKVSSPSAWKSDMYIPNQLNNIPDDQFIASTKDGCGEYYKKYEHDEVPVKEFYNSSEGTGDNMRPPSITNSQIDRIESKVLKNMSQELQTEPNSISSLDSNIKFFKTTCEQIFDTFYATMQDFELYKEKYNDILEKNKTDSTVMEDFIKEMIQHIMSNESVIERKVEELNNTIAENKSEQQENKPAVVEAYKNENYLKVPPVDDVVTKTKHSLKNGEVFNIYLLNNAPFVEIRMNNRNMLSEINIKNPNHNLNVDSEVASAENIRKIATKKKEMEGHAKEKPETHNQDIEIPIKVSYAKKNIHLNEDFNSDHERIEKSLMSRICGFLCKKFRKNI